MAAEGMGILMILLSDVELIRICYHFAMISPMGLWYNTPRCPLCKKDKFVPKRNFICFYKLGMI